MNILSALLLTFPPSEQGSVLLNSFPVYLGLKVVHFLYADMLCSAYFLFSSVIMAETAVQSRLNMSSVFVTLVIYVA